MPSLIKLLSIAIPFVKEMLFGKMSMVDYIKQNKMMSFLFLTCVVCTLNLYHFYERAVLLENRLKTFTCNCPKETIEIPKPTIHYIPSPNKCVVNPPPVQMQSVRPTVPTRPREPVAPPKPTAFPVQRTDDSTIDKKLTDVYGE